MTEGWMTGIWGDLIKHLFVIHFPVIDFLASNLKSPFRPTSLRLNCPGNRYGVAP
jgi:hypothetical protein